MSSVAKQVKKVETVNREEKRLQRDQVVTNFMGGDSYVMDPITTLRMMSAASIFGEPAYYKDSSLKDRRHSRVVVPSLDRTNGFVREFLMFLDESKGDTVQGMENAIDKALEYDFRATLDWAVELRKEYFMRLNPQVIMVRAAIHPKRQEFTSMNPGVFGRINNQVMMRADDCMSQMAYYLYKMGSKNKVPSVLKRSWADRMSKMDAYQVNKYKNAEIGMIDAVRICHASSPIINELMKNGTVEVAEDKQTWENMRSAGKSWEEIFKTVKMGHMALLRNIRGFFTEVEDKQICKEYLETLKSGVLSGKQFPFRYYSAYCAVKKLSSDDIHFRQLILDTLEDCVDISIANMPHLSGTTVCLSDNSGSAWGTFESEYGSVTVAEIDNLSSVITAACSDEGIVVKFGDTHKVYEISKRTGILKQAQEISEDRDNDVGGSTEGGIWEYLHKIMSSHKVVDNIFIYSDQQAGTGGLYGTSEQSRRYGKTYGCDPRNPYGSFQYINVFKMILDYRTMVNPKVNVFSVQTAGYDNSVLPQYSYRTNLLYGWTGRESTFAKVMIDLWDEVEADNE